MRVHELSACHRRSGNQSHKRPRQCETSLCCWRACCIVCCSRVLQSRVAIGQTWRTMGGAIEGIGPGMEIIGGGGGGICTHETKYMHMYVSDYLHNHHHQRIPT